MGRRPAAPYAHARRQDRKAGLFLVTGAVHLAWIAAQPGIAGAFLGPEHRRNDPGRAALGHLARDLFHHRRAAGRQFRHRLGADDLAAGEPDHTQDV
ncbi:hypothetical protein DSD19_07170 [Rhodovulum sp. BSW8]|nr:hypothetical protein DSD19_07170 [Rhodovulum sp. BSW8]